VKAFLKYIIDRQTDDKEKSNKQKNNRRGIQHDQNAKVRNIDATSESFIISNPETECADKGANKPTVVPQSTITSLEQQSQGKRLHPKRQ
jgi:hypothetical protein